MASVHKTFATGTQLTATDLNGALNPDTADHIPYAQAAGGVSVNFPANDTTQYSVAVPFPAGRFSVAPNIVVNVNTAAANSRYLNAWAGAQTDTGFTLMYSATSNLATPLNGIPINWQAVQMTPTSASG